MTTMKATMSNTMQSPSTVVCDVLVIGSGAGGMSAAVTAAHGGADVHVIERASVLGGATSWSGGWMFTPGTRFATKAGVVDSVDDVSSYVQAVTGDFYDDKRVRAFLEAAPDMVHFFEDDTSLQFVPGTNVNDIYGDLPHAGTGNRSVAPKPINGRSIPRSLRKMLRRQLYETSFVGMGIMAGSDLQKFLAAAQRNLAGLAHATWRVGLHIIDMIIHREGMQFVNGTALTARLALSAVHAGVTLSVNTSAEHLITDDRGGVIGAVATTPDGTVRYLARNGVVLATGGYPHDVARRGTTFPRTPGGAGHWPLSPDTCDGAGARMAEAVGAHFRTDVKSPAAWCPVSVVPYRSGRVGTFPHIMDRAKPGSIGVLSTGKRFVNEANGYYDYVAAMMESAPEGEPVESWQIIDHAALRKYSVGMAKMWPVPLFPYLRSGYLKRAKSIRELAVVIGVDADQLEATVTTFNENARKGVDPEFGRGSTPFNRYGGDAKVEPNPSLAPLERGPFYAVKVLPGSFGTFAGISTDENARALTEDGTPIAGLYVAGNDQASVMGGFYPAGGINLGPAMTFGYIAGRQLASGNNPRVRTTTTGV